MLEIRHRAAPVAIHAIASSDVEDDSTGAAQAALRLTEQLTRLRLLVATELIVGGAGVRAGGAGAARRRHRRGAALRP